MGWTGRGGRGGGGEGGGFAQGGHQLEETGGDRGLRCIARCFGRLWIGEERNCSSRRASKATPRSPPSRSCEVSMFFRACGDELAPKSIMLSTALELADRAVR